MSGIKVEVACRRVVSISEKMTFVCAKVCQLSSWFCWSAFLSAEFYLFRGTLDLLSGGIILMPNKVDVMS